MNGRSSAGWVPSMYGGAGGFGTRIAQSSNSSSSSASLNMGGGAGVVVDGKLTMQNLNDRLSTYVDKVRSLEAANRNLEQQIRDFYEKRANDVPDYSCYYATISDLRAQIEKQWSENQNIMLQIDNSRLAAEDFKTKYEFEHHLHKVVEADVLRLRGVRDSMTLTISDLEMQIEGLKDELACMKQTHKEETTQMRQQSKGSVNVEVDIGCSIDLSKLLEEVREQYENVVKKNKHEVEKWFQSKVETLQKTIVTCETEAKASAKEVAELKRTYQSLEINRNSAYAELELLEQNLKEVKTCYGAQLCESQRRVTMMETELQQLKASIEQQQICYKQLLDIKMRLEMEIAEYRRLLQGDQCVQQLTTQCTQAPQATQVTQCTPVAQPTQVPKKVEQKGEEHKPHIERRVKTIVQQVVDGQVVSSDVDTQVETIQ
ncbi:keratin, type I cytoskeletal 19-like [Mugil cephalus]|uniref:keratin, type I cytoskeletal 19-like n=1 Tax=Mugil cephalus TaxID=48193 RepID=UPI001FB7DF39|nr:keratin, type I cytoskeletal 19-like [Mugil cephalus]